MIRDQHRVNGGVHKEDVKEPTNVKNGASCNYFPPYGSNRSDLGGANKVKMILKLKLNKDFNKRGDSGGVDKVKNDFKVYPLSRQIMYVHLTKMHLYSTAIIINYKHARGDEKSSPFINFDP